METCRLNKIIKKNVWYSNLLHKEYGGTQMLSRSHAKTFSWPRKALLCEHEIQVFFTSPLCRRICKCYLHLKIIPSLDLLQLGVFIIVMHSKESCVEYLDVYRYTPVKSVKILLPEYPSLIIWCRNGSSSRPLFTFISVAFGQLLSVCSPSLSVTNYPHFQRLTSELQIKFVSSVLKISTCLKRI